MGEGLEEQLRALRVVDARVKIAAAGRFRFFHARVRLCAKYVTPAAQTSCPVRGACRRTRGSWEHVRAVKRSFRHSIGSIVAAGRVPRHVGKPANCRRVREHAVTVR
jgi:hypothetical protein